MNGENPAGTPPTGDERVDEAIAKLSRLTDTPVEQHPAVLEEVHGQLSGILSEMEPEKGEGEVGGQNPARR